MSQKSPLAIVNETFGAKDKLVDKLVGLLDRGDESKDDLRKRLSSAANVKLLRLHQVATTVKDKFGSRDAMVEQVAKALGRTKDKPFVERLAAYSDARLVDLAKATERKAKKSVKAKKPAKAKAAK
jgi:HPt (histidine-containing phosphotransfer) domain-containing protein